MGTPVETRSLIGPDKIMPKTVTTSGYRPQHSRNSSGASTGYSSSNNSEKTTSGHHRTTGSHQRTTSWDYNRSDNQALVDSLFTDLPLKKTTWYPVLLDCFRSTSGLHPIFIRSTSGQLPAVLFGSDYFIPAGTVSFQSVCHSVRVKEECIMWWNSAKMHDKKCTTKSAPNVISHLFSTVLLNHPLRIKNLKDAIWLVEIFSISLSSANKNQSNRLFSWSLIGSKMMSHSVTTTLKNGFYIHCS